MTDVKTYDLIISGGGMVGQTLALLLSRMLAGIKIAIIEQQPPQAAQPASFDERVLALSAGTLSALQTLGVWPEIGKHAESIASIHVSDRGHFGKVRMHAQEYGLAQLGAVIAAHHLGEGVVQACHASPNLQFFSPDSLQTTELAGGLRLVQLSSGKTIAAPLLVVAEGTNSATVSLLGLDAEQHDYQQHAVIANLVTHLPHHGWAFERFTSAGPIALLPMTENRRALVWTVQASQAAQVAALDEAEFIARLQPQLGYRAGAIIKVGKPSHYPLQFRYLPKPISSRALVLGNAAHALHPIAGQGFNLGFRDLLVLTELLRKAFKQNVDIGSERLLQEYVALRKPDQQQVVQGTHLLALGFANQHLPAELLRNLALTAVGRCSEAKRRLVAAAAGVNFRLIEDEEGLHAEF